MFRGISLPKIENLDIPDGYGYMDEELVALMEKQVEYHIQGFVNP